MRTTRKRRKRKRRRRGVYTSNLETVSTRDPYLAGKHKNISSKLYLEVTSLESWSQP